MYRAFRKRCLSLFVSSRRLPRPHRVRRQTAASRAGSSKQLVSALLGGTRGGGPWGLGANGGGAFGDVGGGDAWGRGGAEEGDRAGWNGAIEMKLTGDTQRESFVDGEQGNDLECERNEVKSIIYVVVAGALLAGGPDAVACRLLDVRSRLARTRMGFFMVCTSPHHRTQLPFFLSSLPRLKH